MNKLLKFNRKLSEKKWFSINHPSESIWDLLKVSMGRKRSLNIGGKRTFQKNSIKSERSIIVQENKTEIPAVSTSVSADSKPWGKIEIYGLLYSFKTCISEYTVLTVKITLRGLFHLVTDSPNNKTSRASQFYWISIMNAQRTVPLGRA